MHEINKAALVDAIQSAVSDFSYTCEEPNFVVKANIYVSDGWTKVEIFEERN